MTNYSCGLRPHLQGNTVSAVQLEPIDFQPSEPAAPAQPVNPYLPNVIPNPPTIRVPANPLLPEGYREIITYDNLQNLNGFLRTQIGNYAIVEFLIGNNDLVERAGILVAVGLNYIILQDTNTDTYFTCDFYNIKFVTFRY